MARRDRRQIKTVGLDNPSFGVALAVALAVRAVLHRHQAGLDQAAVEPLRLTFRQTECLLLQQGRRPDDRPPSPLPILRLGETEQPVDRMHQARGQTQPGRRGLESRKQLAVAPSTPSGNPAKLSAARSTLNRPGVNRRKPVGLPASPLRGASSARFSISIAPPPLGLGRDGQTSPVSGNGNFRLQLRLVSATRRSLLLSPT